MGWSDKGVSSVSPLTDLTETVLVLHSKGYHLCIKKKNPNSECVTYGHFVFVFIKMFEFQSINVLYTEQRRQKNGRLIIVTG